MSRPRLFDENEALDRAMKLFWAHGYEGTSLTHLTCAMGINRPSLYAAFGNKEALFRRALERYAEGPGAAVRAALALPTARASVQALLGVYADAAGEPERPRGCFLVNGAMACSPEASLVRDDLSQWRAASMEALRERFERGRHDGELADTVNPSHLARYYWSVLCGMAVNATDGASAAELHEVAALAMAAWPEGRT